MQNFSKTGIILAALAWCIGLRAPAQMDRAAQHLRQVEPTAWAITHAHIVTGPGKTPISGTLLVRDGKVERVQAGNQVPSGYSEIDAQNGWICPAFIDAYSLYGQQEAKSKGKGGIQYGHGQPGPYHWNEAVKPEFETATTFAPDPAAAKEMRAQGFATVHSVPSDGIFRGTSAWVSLQDNPTQASLQGTVASVLSFSKGVSRQQYPESLMGTIALMRQTFLDAQWYNHATQQAAPGATTPPLNLSFQALSQQMASKVPFFFVAGDYQHTLRANRVMQEAGQPCIYKTNGDEYNRPDAFSGYQLVIPLTFPKAYDLSNPSDERYIPLGKLKAWEQAPSNAFLLEKQGTAFAITAEGLKEKAEFWPALQKAIEHGLSETQALASLTTIPAQFMGITAQAGTLEPGKRADFLLFSDNPFQYKDETLHETWIGGQRHIIKPLQKMDATAQFTLSLPSQTFALQLKGKKNIAILGSDTLDAEVQIAGNAFTLTLGTEDRPVQYRMAGMHHDGKLEGYATLSDGSRQPFTGQYIADQSAADKTDKRIQVKSSAPLASAFPNKAFGFSSLPQAKETLIRNVTVWTNDKAGIVSETDVLLKNGKVAKVGKNLSASQGAVIVDGKGTLHLTPGIIDEHSHIAISRGVNEGSHACTAEVRIGDVLNCEDINIYRQLAGGVTAAQLLHGSANPIGGQSALIKLRWGSLPEEMKIEGAEGYIKFALGENVKQSNWGNEFSSRYPQTRTGVEQFMQDIFQAALDYRKTQTDWNKNKSGKLPPRRDLQLETVLEILDSKRHVTCHSYVQSEINMLMHLAERFGFRINTFTHILEGYKVAQQMKEHGASGSTFSDWWAYKYEVIDAIPYNAMLMHEAGINVCINSDDAEMGRRLNQEAAKAVKYGGMSEEDALKMVTLNPAKALRLDHRMGMVASGMDADLVLWNAHPLSIYAKPLQTYVDGRLLYDEAQDLAQRAADAATRQRIIRAMLNAPEGERTEIPTDQEEERLYHCDTEGE